MRISRIETIHVDAEYPILLFVRVHTDDGLIGHAEASYTPEAIEGLIHGWIAPQILGRDPADIERIWWSLYDRGAARFGGLGAEMRAISTIDVALWDLLGQATGLPIYQLLGGRVHDSLPVYNTCGGPTYLKPPHGRDGHTMAGPLEDLHAFLYAADDLARDLVAEGFGGLKIWPFDEAALANDGHGISAAQLERSLEPIRRIRDAVGDQIEIMIEGHGFWDLPTAKRIARVVADYRPAWLEDLVLAHDVSVLRELKDSTSAPILASEYLVTRHQFRPLFEARAADIVMMDPVWAGGITECRKTIAMADAYGLPVTMHDAAGPFTLLAGVQLALNAPNATYQEVTRAFIRTWYQDLIDSPIVIERGRLLPPQGPGLGARLRPEVLERPDARVRVSGVR